MSIHLSCNCGHELHLKDAYADKRIRCPTCKAVLAVPSSADKTVPAGQQPVPPQPDLEKPAPASSERKTSRKRGPVQSNLLPMVVVVAGAGVLFLGGMVVGIVWMFRTPPQPVAAVIPDRAA